MTTVVAIDDRHDERLDDYRSLNDQSLRRRYEEATGVFVVEGFVAFDRLVESDHRIRSVLLAPSRLDRFAPHLPALADRGVPVFVAETPVLASIVGFDLHRGVVACAERRPLATIEELIDGASLVAVLEGLNDNENLGAIARTAKAFGVDGILLDPTCTDPYSRRTVRVSMGEVLSMRICRAAHDDWPNAVDGLRDAGFEVWAMTPSADAEDLWSLTPPPKLAILLGAEGPGLTRRAIASANRPVRIPISPAVDSLNVGHAAAVTFAAINGRPRTRGAGSSFGDQSSSDDSSLDPRGSGASPRPS